MDKKLISGTISPFDKRNHQVKSSHTEILNRFSPRYEHLFLTDQVLHRENIYGSGPPVDSVSRDDLNLALRLKPPILDFGCGTGALIRELRLRGFEAYGIELNREMIRNSIRGDVAKYISFYSGTLSCSP